MAIDLSRSRRILPSPMIDRSSYSIFSVIKQAIGKDLTRFSIPVVWNEPLSFLQRLAESLEYVSLLDRAVLTDSPVERFHLITSFIVSQLSTHLERMSKPFNPLLGETFEVKLDSPSSCHYVAEQVSHHPPISAFFIRGNQWTLTANVEPQLKFQGTSVVAISEGRWILRLNRKGGNLSRSGSQSSFHSCHEDNDNESELEDEYTWCAPTVIIHNILFGRLWCEYQGEITIEHRQSNHRAVLTIKTHSWFASQATKDAETFKYSGIIYEGSDPIGAFHGNYGHCYYAIDNRNDAQQLSNKICSAGGHNSIRLTSSDLTRSLPCDLSLTPSSRLIWHRSIPNLTDDEASRRSRYYFFTPFAMALNESIDDPSLPPTDCRFRQDIRFLENGDLEAAAAEKHRLEEQQRAEARVRQGEYQPLWFKKDERGIYQYTGEYDQRKFDHCPNLFSQASFL